MLRNKLGKAPSNPQNEQNNKNDSNTNKLPSSNINKT